MSEKVNGILDQIKGLSTLELAELQKALESGAIMNTSEQ